MFTAAEFAKKMYNTGIRAVGWDFDATALSYDTNPQTNFVSRQDFLRKYVKQMTPLFVQSVIELDKLGIKQSIVTFNDDKTNCVLNGTAYRVGGHALVRPVLQELFPPNLSNKIEILAFDPQLHDSISPDGLPIEQNKNWHLQSMKQRYSIPDNRAVLLVDNDATNIHDAQAEGYRVFYVQGKQGFEAKNYSFY